jgi:hypothetical protein
MRYIAILVLVLTSAPAAATADATDALMVLSTVGYLTGAADGCKVASAESNALASGMALAISSGKYGDPAQAHMLFNNARQKGITSATAGKVDCNKVAASIRDYSRSLLKDQ